MPSTVAALATHRGRSALALVRMTGPETRAILNRVFKPLRPGSGPEHSKVIFGRIFDQGTLVDTVGVVFYQGPGSYTGEDMAEITCHGGPAVPDAVLRALIRAGASPAQAGEFTLRAFLNGKMDLTQALGVDAMTRARTGPGLEIAVQRVSGHLGRKINSLSAKLTRLIALFEASLDFPEDVPDVENPSEKITQLAREIREMTQASVPAELLWHGADVVIAGPPNAGKSTLFNALLGRDRAIVHPRPGTTRDYISETVEIDGYTLRLHDTAGIGDFPEGPDSAAVERSLEISRKADLVVYLSETGTGYPPGCLRVLSKADLFKAKAPDGVLPVSGLTGHGLQELKKQVIKKLGGLEKPELALFRREQNLLAEAEAHLIKAARTPETELAAQELWEAARAMEAVVGKSLNQDVIQEIFSNFCLGK